MRFEVTPTFCIYNSDNYKIYACYVDSKKYPEIKLNKYSNVTISGDCGDLLLNVLYDIEAEEKQGKYGFEYKITYIKQQKPMSKNGLLDFLLACNLTYQQAQEVVDEYPNIIDLVMSNEVDKIDTKKLYNIGEYRLNVIINKIKQNFMLAEVIERLGGYFTFNIIKKLFEYYGSTSKIISALQSKPYSCLCQINRIGFKTADKILIELDKKIQKSIQEGKEPPLKFENDLITSKDRCLAAITYILDDNENNGNTVMDIHKIGKTLKSIVPECCNYFVDICKSNNGDEEISKYIYIDLQNKLIANAVTHYKEKSIGEIITSALSTPIKWDINIEKYRNNENVSLTNEQLNTLKMVCENNISILSGYAGSGKSASTLSLIKMLKDNDKSFLLLAPTGRASKVLSEYTHNIAFTIHKFLFSMKNTDDNCKLLYDVVIVDEVSMCDLSLFYDLVTVIDFTRTKLLLVGDPAQLPSVGAGNILFDLINCKKVPTNSLTKIFRYGNNSILTVATDIRNSTPYLHKNLTDNNYVFVETPQETIIKKIKVLYKKLIESGYTANDILILSSYNKGGYGTVAINNALQDVVNKNINKPENNIQIKCGEGQNSETIKFCVDDIVIQTKNNYKAILCDEQYQPMLNDFDKYKEVFIPNGEIGSIKLIDKKFGKVFIKFDNDIVMYSQADMYNVKLAYSISIHKSQGGSAKIIILLTPKAHTYMLNSNLLYVGVTRAKDKIIHFGTEKTVNLAIKKKADLSRVTCLQNYIQ